MTKKERDEKIINAYLSQKYLTSAIAKRCGVTVRQVQRIVKAAGVSRTKEESNKVLAKLKDCSKNGEYLKKMWQQIKNPHNLPSHLLEK